MAAKQEKKVDKVTKNQAAESEERKAAPSDDNDEAGDEQISEKE